MIYERERFLKNILQIFDAITVSLAFFVSFFLIGFIRNYYHLVEMAYAPSFDFSGAIFFFKNNLSLFISAIVFWLVFLSSFGVYRDFRIRSFWGIIWITLKTSFFMILALGSVVFLTKMTLTSRLFILTYAGVSITLILAEKKTVNFVLEILRKSGYNSINLLIVGTGKRAQHFIDTVQKHSKWGLKIIGLIDDEPGKVGLSVKGFKVLGRLRDMPIILHEYVVDNVVFVVPRSWLSKIENAIIACENEGVGAYISIDLYNTKISKLKQSQLGNIPLLEFDTVPANEWQLFVKRTIDIILTLIGIVIAAPLFLIIMIGIKLSSPGPIFFKQERVGVNGRRFTLYKFRTMRIGSEIKKKDLERKNEMKGPVFKIKHDPRVYPFGRFLRKTSMDELPQLFNVLKGDMSIVGPRPPLSVEVDMYEIWQRRRLSLKPGLTCVWQVSGRNEVDFDEWMQMDLDYIDNWSLWIDIKIIFKTFFVVLFGYGAY
ncbi:MAG TPA: sugar transferase [Bacteroidetes bacterium]|nr:sugar transferase [Bacteroidota bacterium]